MELKQLSSEQTDYGSTTSTTTTTTALKFENKPLSLESERSSTPSTGFSIITIMHNFFKCDSDRFHMHCAAVSGVLPEYGNTVGDSLIVPYLLELGAPVWTTSYVWIITPFIDSWMQPIYGKLSDKLTSSPNACCKCGGRKPFIILFGIFATIGLIVIPQARLIKRYGHIAAAVIVCIVSYTLMDMSHGDLLIPTRALLNDLCNDSKLMKYGNEKFTFYQAIGRCLGYLVVSIDWKPIIGRSTPKFAALLTDLHLDHHVSICFTLSIFILWIIILFVILSTPYQTQRLYSKRSVMRTAAIQYQQRSNKSKTVSNEMLITPSGRVVILRPTMLITETISSILSSDRNCDVSELTELSSSFQLSPFDDAITGDMLHIDNPLSPVHEKKEKSKDIIYDYKRYNFNPENKHKNCDEAVIENKDKNKDKVYDINDTECVEEENIINTHNVLWKFPFHFKLYWIIQFFGWGNFAAFSLYFTSFVAIDIYNGDPNASKKNSVQFDNFEKGVRVATTVLLVSAIIAALSGKFIIPFLNNRIGVKLTFFVGELILNILLLLLIFGNGGNINDIICVVIIVCLYGVSIQIHYNNVFIIIEHDLRDLYKSEDRRAYVLSIFNLSILFANVLVSIFAGWIVSIFHNQFVWGIVFFAMIALIGDIIVYIIFFVTERHHMLDTQYLHNINLKIPNNIIIDI